MDDSLVPSPSTAGPLCGTAVEHDDEDEEEVLIEPRFKYNRILSNTPDRETVSCFAVHDKLIAVGYSGGHIRIFDVIGNLHSDYTSEKHKCAVSQIAVESSGNYVFSCANDGKVCVMGIGHNDHAATVTLSKESARCVAVTENFIKPGNQKFIVGERRLLIFEPRFFSKYSERCLYQGQECDGYILAVSWKNDYIAFTNESGTRIYDCRSRGLLTLIQPLHIPEPYYSSRFPPNHCWFDANTLAVGWGSAVIVSKIAVSRPNPQASSIKRVHVVHRIQLSHFNVAGISFTIPAESEKSDRAWKEIVLFGIKVAEDKARSTVGDDAVVGFFDDVPHPMLRRCFQSLASQASCRSVAQSVRALQHSDHEKFLTELLLILPTNLDKYIVVSEDAIEMKQTELMFLRQFHLGSLPADSVYYLLGPRELIEARPCSVDDRITWFIENGLLIEATNCALNHRDELQETTVSEVGKRLIDKLIENGKFNDAVNYLPPICGRHKEEWEYYVGEFEKHGEVLKLVPILPQKQPQLEPECYEYVLVAALYAKAELFLKLIKLLPSDLYRIGAIVKSLKMRINERVSREELVPLSQALARLYAHERRFDLALRMFLELKDPDVFALIRQYHLFAAVKDRVVELMEIDDARAIRLLLDHEGELVDSATIVTQLNRKPKLQMEYLNQLVQRDEGNEYGDLLVRLYAEHAPERLMPYLRKADNYQINKAIEVCQKHNLQSELVFLLGRSGNRLAALETIILQMHRCDLAIEFCAEHTEEDLWERLIELSMGRSEDVAEVLRVSGTYVNPVRVIEKIPKTMEVENLQTLLHKVLRDSKLQVGLIQDCVNIGFTDAWSLYDSFVSNTPALLDSSDGCPVCKESLFLSQKDVMLLGCGHYIHDGCVPKSAFHRATSHHNVLNRHASDEHDMASSRELSVGLAATAPTPYAEEVLCKERSFFFFDLDYQEPVTVNCPVCG